MILNLLGFYNRLFILKYISWLNYSYELLVINQWSGVDNLTCPAGSQFCFEDGDEIIAYTEVKKVT